MNELAGERELKLGENTYVLRPSFEALVEMESRTKKSVIQLFNEHYADYPLFSDIIAVCYACVKAGMEPGARAPSFEAFGREAYPVGIAALRAAAFGCVIFVMSQGREDLAEKKTKVTSPIESTGGVSTGSQSQSSGLPPANSGG